MASIYQQTAELLTTITRLSRLAVSVHDALLEDQAAAVAPGSRAGGGVRQKGRISDPTGVAIVGSRPDDVARSVLSSYAALERDVNRDIRSVTRACGDLEATCQRVLSESAAILNGKPGHDEPRCPGYSAERRARLGGCGNHPAHWRMPSGQVVNRHDLGYCVECMREERAATESEAA